MRLADIVSTIQVSNRSGDLQHPLAAAGREIELFRRLFKEGLVLVTQLAMLLCFGSAQPAVSDTLPINLNLARCDYPFLYC